MKLLTVLSLTISIYTFQANAQYWGYGLYGGMQGCNSKVSIGAEAKSYKDEIKQLKAELKKISVRQRKVNTDSRKADRELKDLDRKLKFSFNDDAYSFITSHFDNQNTCSSYDGFQGVQFSGTTIVSGGVAQSGSVNIQAGSPLPVLDENPSGVSVNVEQQRVRTRTTTTRVQSGNSEVINEPKRPAVKGRPAPIAPPASSIDKEQVLSENKRSPASDDSEAKQNSIDIPELKRDWTKLCSNSKDGYGKLSASVCDQKYMMKPYLTANKADCKNAINNYVRVKEKANSLQSELQALNATVSDLNSEIESSTEAMTTAAEEYQQSRTQGGVCVGCLTSQSYEDDEPDMKGVITNSLAALVTYGATKSYNNRLIDSNSDLGRETNGLISPTLAALPSILGAVNAGTGQGSYACSGLSAGVNGLSNPLGPYAALMGQGQIGGALGTPAWALANNASGGMYLNGVNPLVLAQAQMGLQVPSILGNNLTNGLVDPYSYAALNGTAGLNGNALLNGGLLAGPSFASTINNPYALLNGNPYGAVAQAGIPGILGVGGLGGLNGLGALGGGTLGGLNGTTLGGVNSLGGLGTMDPSTIQMRNNLIQQQLSAQMRAYENALKQQQTLSGLDVELAGVLQRRQQLLTGGSLSNTGFLGGNYQFGSTNTATFGGLPNSTGIVPLGNRQ